MIDSITKVCGFTIGACATTTVNALGAYFLGEKCIAPQLGVGQYESRITGIIAGGVLAIHAFQDLAFDQAFNLAARMTTIFWSAVGARGLSEDSTEMCNELLGMGLGLLCQTIVQYTTDIPAIDLVIGAAVAGYFGREKAIDLVALDRI